MRRRLFSNGMTRTSHLFATHLSSKQLMQQNRERALSKYKATPASASCGQLGRNICKRMQIMNIVKVLFTFRQSIRSRKDSWSCAIVGPPSPRKTAAKRTRAGGSPTWAPWNRNEPAVRCRARKRRKARRVRRQSVWAWRTPNNNTTSKPRTRSSHDTLGRRRVSAPEATGLISVCGKCTEKHGRK